MRLKVFNEKLWQVKIVNNCHNNDILSYRYERKGKIMGKTKLWFFLFFDLSSDFCHNYEVLSIFGVNFYFYLMNCYDIPSRNLEIHLFLEFIFSHFQIFVKFFVYFLFHNSNIYYNYDFFVLFSTFSSHNYVILLCHIFDVLWQRQFNLYNTIYYNQSCSKYCYIIVI